MRVVKKKAHENLTDESISKVISLLRQDSPITKKEACEILNIRYNTTRLQNIIDDFEQTLARKERFKARTDSIAYINTHTNIHIQVVRLLGRS